MNKFFNESKYFFKIGFPMLGSQLSYMIMFTTDTIVAGRAGAEELAGVVIANAFLNPVYMFMAGIIFSVIPIVAHLNGAQRYREIGVKIREIFWLALFLGFLLLIFGFFGSNLLSFFPIEEEIISISIAYLKAVSVGMF
ncbi:MAG: MATE family efflux transporter, partial [Pseudomonadota bacterium]|nr:MATE family efflux transporter [Pseudomonadota bacterium]